MKLKYIIILIFAIIGNSAFSGNPKKTTSVLAEGEWYKIAVSTTGIHKITYADFKNMGFDVDHLASSTIRVFGNGGGMLPESNAGFRFDDLRENAIEVFDGGDGTLNEGDYILFYGEAPDRWIFNYSTRLYTHSKNLYSDSTYYFINVGLKDGNKVATKPYFDTLPNTYSRKFDDFLFYEKDSLNLIKSGRTWYGDVFNQARSSYNFSFNFPNIDTLSPIRMYVNVAARSASISKFYLYYKGVKQDSIIVDQTDLQGTNIYAKPKLKLTNLPQPKSVTDITLMYDVPDNASTGWLDYIELICARSLKWIGPQMSFRDANTIGKKNITEYVMTGMDSSVVVWDVTDKEKISRMTGILTNGTLKFRTTTDTLREFIAFDRTFYYPVHLIGAVANQNLHGIEPNDLIIVTHPRFRAQADSLAAFHIEESNLSTVVVNSDQVYNEFGSGNADLTAIRDFVKMLYDRGFPGQEPRYLLLFGDGSYDPKNRIKNNNNMIPTYQSLESLKFIGTYVTDDYYGIMGDKQGDGSNGTINIGIGRFPVTTVSDASIMLRKILNYSSNADSVMSDWRNEITFIADDENRNLHTIQAEELADIVKTKYPVFNVDKIYLDAYQMVQVPQGLRFPDVNKAINHAVAKGSLIINYTGHGGEDGWAGEKVLTIPDIQSWTNFKKLPVFITATCEFSRFDNPERYTAGEMVLVHPNGGAIALYSTTRLALSTSNFRLDSSFFMNLLPDTAGKPIPKMGDLIKISKNNNTNNNNIRNFVLLGDPAQTIAYPKYTIKTTAMNQKAISTEPDTTLGMSEVNVEGEVVDLAGNRLTQYNGIIYPKVFDKATTYRTLGNTEDSYAQDFVLQNSVLYRGNSQVTNGSFNFSFMVPKSVNVQLGNGKISYYATDSIVDAWGYYDNFLIGGQDPTVNPTNNGPDIQLYLDNTNFKNGDRTGTDPLLIVLLADDNGINYTNVGIGHEIIGILDGDAAHPLVLNDFYHPDLGTYTSGSVTYPFEGLVNGRHTLRVKAWDLFNNSNETEIVFFVNEMPTVSASRLINYPNPMSDQTTFRFIPEPNTGAFNGEIRIYNQTGILVKTIQVPTQASSSEVISIPWDGASDSGDPLSQGMYIYELVLQSSNGAYFQATQKLIIVN